MGDISLNPSPLSNPQVFKQEWQDFRKRGLYLIHLNMNSLLLKIDELRDIAQRTKAAVISISKSKHDSTVLIQKFKLKIMKFFLSIEIGTEEVLLVPLVVKLAIN